MVTDLKVTLYKNQFVIVEETGKFLRFKNGRIVIYKNKEEATEEAGAGDKVVCATDLTEVQQEILRENILIFSIINR